METPLYKIWRGDPNAGWFALSGEEQQARLRKDAEAQAELGARSLLACDAWWSNERWALFGIGQYPNAAALIQHGQKLVALGWPQVMEAESLLATSSGKVTMPENPQSGIYKLALGRIKAAGYALGEDEKSEMGLKLEQSLHDSGAIRVVTGDLISSEMWQFFVLEHFPSMEAVIAHRRCMDDLDWFRYVEADVLLGVRV